MKLPEGYVPGVGVPKTSGGYGGYGQKMLEKMGWTRGQGLGRGKTGMAEAIEVAKKEDTLGVGATQTGWKWDWKYWEDAYNGAIAAVNHSSGSGSGSDSGTTSTDTSSSSETDTSSGSSSSDSDPSSRGGGARPSGSESDDDDSSGDDGAGPALGRLMACAVAVNRDGTLASGSAEELALAKSLAKSGPWVAGRFGGREGKMARIRAQEEKQAAEARSKLGIEAAPAASAGAASGGAAASGPSKKRKGSGGGGTDTDAGAGAATDADSSKRRKKGKGKGGGEEEEEAEEGGKAAKKQKKQQRQEEQQQQEQQQQGQQERPKPRVIIVALKGEEARPVEPFQPTPAEGWWGAKMFMSAGRLEGMEDEEQQAQQQQAQEKGAAEGKGEAQNARRAAFDEDTQAALYNRLQAAQRQGKRGMGRAAVKIAGGNWEGKKTTFGDEGDEDDGGGGDGDGGAEGEAPAQQQQQQQQQPAAEAAGAEGGSGGGKKKKRGGKAKEDKEAGDQRKPAEAEAATAGGPGKRGGKRKAAEAAAAGAEAGAGPAGAPKVKWVKLAVAELQRAPKKRLRWSLLWAALWQHEAVSGSGAGSKEAKAAAWARISGSSRLRVDGKKVGLASAAAVEGA